MCVCPVIRKKEQSFQSNIAKAAKLLHGVENLGHTLLEIAMGLINNCINQSGYGYCRQIWLIVCHRIIDEIKASPRKEFSK
ncbi:hypothetical protein CDAR_472921 [Caerostris darwini]|uniref:Uncharacterized protein n=1 Tax=Caerostris darwini TaxID=1538125 RepID=A0AAV4VA20_9ARAC|nr:hypothetical protein CDAR_472921 [Caerostris darwini]